MPPIDAASPQLANILGVGVSAIDMDEALRRSEQHLRERRKGYICVTGVHGIMEAQRDPALRGILNRAYLCTPDGMPTIWIGRLQGHPAMSRVYGPDFMMEICRRSTRYGFRHFLYGGGPGVADKLRHKLEEKIPGIQIVGSFTPPFRPLNPTEEAEVIEAIGLAKPDIVWVGLSTPKQERFMAGMIERLDTRLMIGVGAAFDIHAGLLADAPRWIKQCGMQWLHRLAIEPRRLWKRYLTNNPRFIWNISLQLIGWKRFTLTTCNPEREARSS